MKRSEINDIVLAARDFMRAQGFNLPPFADWRADRMRQPEGATLRARGMGWDVTDYGTGRFAETGLVLFTLRNGDAADLASGRGMLYAEKAMVVREGQSAPMHRHVVKAEDIINRAGGDLVLTVFGADAAGDIDERAPVTVTCDGTAQRVPAGGEVRLRPGESATVLPGLWHAFRAEGADCLAGEVSTVNDDRADNVFREEMPRFPAIEEDVAALRLLVCDFT